MANGVSFQWFKGVRNPVLRMIDFVLPNVCFVYVYYTNMNRLSTTPT